MINRLVFCCLATALLACSSVDGKCPRLYIDVFGQVAAPLSDRSKIRVEIEPASNVEEHQIPVTDGEFRKRLQFDTTRSGGRLSHDCRRRPVSVELLLMEGDAELDRIELEIAEDFQETELGDYVLREAARLEAREER